MDVFFTGAAWNINIDYALVHKHTGYRSGHYMKSVHSIFVNPPYTFTYCIFLKHNAYVYSYILCNYLPKT